MRITLLTDFGDRDGFVGAMKGVIAARAPDAHVIDLAHHVPRGDIRHASFVLYATAPFFPAGTCHVVVVDPGVGTERRGVAMAVGEQLYVAPDNGVLTDTLNAATGRIVGVELTNAAFWQHPVSNTFHGRDIFSPVAAHLALGVPLSALGVALDPATLVRLPSAVVDVGEGLITGEVCYIDGFGNAVTNISRSHLADLDPDGQNLQISADTHQMGRLERTYGSVAEGQPVAVIGSCGRLELAICSGSAAEQLGLHTGSAVVVRRV